MRTLRRRGRLGRRLLGRRLLGRRFLGRHLLSDLLGLFGRHLAAWLLGGHRLGSLLCRPRLVHSRCLLVLHGSGRRDRTLRRGDGLLRLRRRFGVRFGLLVLVLLFVRHSSLSSSVGSHARYGRSGCARSPAWRASAAPCSRARRRSCPVAP